MKPSELTKSGWIACLILLQVYVLRADGVDIHPGFRKPMHNLHQVSVYPNPFDQFTTLTYRPEKTGFVRIFLYSSQGELVGKIYDDLMEGGSVYQIELTGEELESGVYWCAIETNKKVIRQKLEIVR